jgi:hypothetical protein
VETDFETMSKLVGGGAAGFVGLGWAARALIRRVARDWRDVQAEGAEIDALSVWKEEAKTQRERADKAYHERNAAVQELGAQTERALQLAQTIEHLRLTVALLEKRVASCQARIEELLSDRSGRYPATGGET